VLYSPAEASSEFVSRRCSPWACAWFLAAALSWVGCSSGGGNEPDVVSIVAPDLAAAGRAAATLLGDDTEREIRIGPPRRRGAEGPGRERALFDAVDGTAIGRLLLGSSSAALHYHLASRDAGLPRGAFQRNRLVVLESGGAKSLGLLLESEAGPRRTAGIAELGPEDAPRMLALAEALGAWSVVRRDRYLLDDAGRPMLPYFTFEPGGDWRVLTQRSLAFFAPEAVARHVVATPGFRNRRYRHLAEYSARVPGLAAAAEALEAGLDVPDLAEELAGLRDSLSTSFEAYQGYLDSTWIEVDVRVRPPDTARVTLYVHSVVDVVIDGFRVKLPRKALVVASEGLSALRLSAEGGAAEAIAPHLAQDRLEFRLGRAVAARPRGAYAFEGVRIDFELTGLARLEARLWPFLEQLEVQVTSAATNLSVPAAHVSKVLSLSDPRYQVGREVGTEAFLASLGRVLERADGEARLLELAGGGAFHLPAGVYELKDDLILPAGHALVLEAGVELRVHPGRSLLVRGPLEVRGTAQRPVRVRGVSLAVPWGVLAVQGRGRSRLHAERPRSLVRHLELSGGSEDQLKGVSYSGQLSVHHQELVLEDSMLHHAFGDDALNVKYGDVTIRNSVFVDNAGDAVDLDWSSGSIETSFFGRSGAGGDGIDVSASEVRVSACVFSDFRDKCLSVGEASTLQLRGSLLRACETAVASKDDSRADVQASVFLDNERNFAAYRKKAIFGGGRIRAEGLVLGGSRKADLQDAVSLVDLSGVRTLESGDAERLRDASAFSTEAFRALSPSSP